jgi:hypothetical protein
MVGSRGPAAERWADRHRQKIDKRSTTTGWEIFHLGSFKSLLAHSTVVGPTTYDRAVDTDPELLREQVDQWRAMSPGERVVVADRLSVDVTRLAIAGIRSRHPDATAAELVHELARRRYGDEIARPLLPRSPVR